MLKSIHTLRILIFLTIQFIFIKHPSNQMYEIMIYFQQKISTILTRSRILFRYTKHKQLLQIASFELYSFILIKSFIRFTFIFALYNLKIIE